MQRKMLYRILSIMLASSVLLTGMPIYAANSEYENAIEIIEEENLEEDTPADMDSSENQEAEISSDEDMEEPELIMLEYANPEPSEYGLISTVMVDQYGEIYENQLTSVEDSELNMLGEEPLPSSYDLRDYGYVTTAIEDQKSTGTCWAHAGVAAVESNMIKKGMANKDYVNVSEAAEAWLSHSRGSKDEKDLRYKDILMGNYGAEKGKSGLDCGGNNYLLWFNLANGKGLINESELVDLSIYSTGYLVKAAPEDKGEKKSGVL